MLRQAAPLRARLVIGGCPFEELGIDPRHVSAGHDARTEVGRFSSPEPRHSEIMVEAQEDDQLIERLQRRTPFDG